MPTSPVEKDELLYRQIGPGGNPVFFDTERMPVVHASQFLPTAEDIDGLSLIRQRYRTPIWSAYRVERPEVRYRLAELSVELLSKIAQQVEFVSLNIDASPDSLDTQFGEPWAHCVLREINRTSYDNDVDAKKRIKSWAREVASRLKVDNVIGPLPVPWEDDPYRP